MKKFSRILIANRGEIALRILRACRELGIESVIVYSEADKDAGYIALADRSVCIGPGPSQQSYLEISKIISAAEIMDVDAIHPGYGFLAENVQFAEICKSCHIEFIGPGVEAISFLGDKGKARELARKVGIPCVPGSTGILNNEDEALDIAREIGYPVIVKAVAGGGGRGWPTMTSVSRMVTRRPGPRPRRPSTIRMFISRSTWRSPGTWRSRSSPTSMERWSILVSETAASSAGIRN